MEFLPSRSHALERLQRFVPRAGCLYRQERNVDHGPAQRENVSCLSPYLRRRVVSELEVLRAVRELHSATACEIFTQEILWRTYWRGWLEARPEIWSSYRAGSAIELEREVEERVQAATSGATGIECFDSWVQELCTTGYLHNHARMWFASIWIYTLRLPWERGAAFFYRHLLDADPASNTLSWRWVAGLHTRGKQYLATAENIARFTMGRFPFTPGLAAAAFPIEDRVSLRGVQRTDWKPIRQGEPIILLLTSEYLGPHSALSNVRRVALLRTKKAGRWFASGELTRRFDDELLTEAGARLREQYQVASQEVHDVDELIDLVRTAGVRQVVSHAPAVGEIGDLLQAWEQQLSANGCAFTTFRCSWDTILYPGATRGFFQFKAWYPTRLNQLLSSTEVVE